VHNLIILVMDFGCRGRRGGSGGSFEKSFSNFQNFKSSVLLQNNQPIQSAYHQHATKIEENTNRGLNIHILHPNYRRFNYTKRLANLLDGPIAS